MEFHELLAALEPLPLNKADRDAVRRIVSDGRVGGPQRALLNRVARSHGLDPNEDLSVKVPKHAKEDCIGGFYIGAKETVPAPRRRRPQ